MTEKPANENPDRTPGRSISHGTNGTGSTDTAHSAPPDDMPATRAPRPTFTGHRALNIEEPLLFETGRRDICGVDLPDIDADDGHDFAGHALGDALRAAPPDLPALSEPETVRHYVRLSQQNFSIDNGPFPLGSCTMKHNPRLNEKLARLPGFADIHPLQPPETVPGALQLMRELAHWLCTLTGMAGVTLAPKAGAQGELCGMIAIRAALAERHGTGKIPAHVLVPDAAHGTNPATAAMLGFSVKPVAGNADGITPAQAVRAAIDECNGEVAAIMLTNPNTCGFFETDILAIADLVRAAGGYFYCDGANFNAIVGRVRPGDLGIDAMHINLHKTFSTPHGGGGPGSGPVVFSQRLARFAPLPFLRSGGADDETPVLVEHEAGTRGDERPFGRICAFHGQMGMFVRALAYIKSHGADGLRAASGDAVLNANYIRAGLEDIMSAPFPGHRCMHETLFDDRFLDGSGLTTLDIAKALIDEGFHPMTIYFPLVARGAMLIEPTESESRAALDLFIAALRDIVFRIRQGRAEELKQSPHFAPRRRLDEAAAARTPVLRHRQGEA